ncbi:uncharacterized protein METZ01_LOCUS66302 [marine metagenome]|uniref:Uncharacterized protein n=1 Tax=marine metagenome TaxID=408172 RepID=A0A381TCY8_9ZZZZ
MPTMIALFTPLAIALSSFEFRLNLLLPGHFFRAKTPGPIASLQI